ncbi:EAL domain-containing protein [Neobacillus mesonae]|uniref:bifunctional diguanylate cyclase/phosphodiesterase n=1 Tax=Neobacillus mesonae TaxID=1193713 RepID=UPI002041287F|nr:EAL domain-containing protein [Neobacillus mesonae]MCM3569730.1 EAL domain-containing protein [Neobacillus mesonae]
MRKKALSHKFIWILLFCLLVLMELSDVTASFLFPTVNIFRFSAIIILIAIIPYFIFTVKRMRLKDLEFEQNKVNLNKIFDTLDVAIWSHDLKTNTLLITPGIEKLYGYALTDFYQDSTLWKKVIFPEDLPMIDEREKKTAIGKAVTTEYRIIRQNGDVRWILDKGFPTLDDKGNLVFFTSVLFDITDRKETEDRYRSLVETSPDIIAVVSRERIEYINEAGWKLVGAACMGDLIGQSPLKFVPINLIEMIQKRLENHLNKGRERLSMEFQVKKLNGDTIDVEMTITPIQYEGKFAVQVVGRDITERKQAEKTIKTMAYYDSLTGLPNRNKFKKYLNKILENQGDKQLAVLFLDVDRFKIINDTKGHTVGDLVLQQVAKRLETAVQTAGLVSRQGGDEFLIVLEDTDKERAVKIADRIINEFASPLYVEDQEFFVTPSIGISLYPDHGLDEETLIKNADTAMYKAKERGNQVVFYASSLNGISVRKMELENGLRKAMEKGELVLHYQPQVSVSTGEIAGAEALIRWNHSEKGSIPPCEFIPLAEETGLIIPIGKWVVKQACKQKKAWEQKGAGDFPIAVNVSARQFEDEKFVGYISEVLEETGLEPHHLELEITETITQNIEQSIHTLNQLKAMGVYLAIDDFGTGYSSLSYLKHLPIDKIKIDKSFVDDIRQATDQRLMVKTIIDMGLNLNFTVIAEGIETDEQLKFLQKNNCHLGQGYLFSRPLPAEEVEGLLLKQA